VESMGMTDNDKNYAAFYKILIIQGEIH